MDERPPHLAALRTSVDHLRDVVSKLDDTQLEQHAYPSEWTIADVLSHIGSSAVIFERRFEDALRRDPTPDDFAPSVWDVWNAKSPRQKADDALAADRSVLERLESLSDEQRSSISFALGPMTFDFVGYVGLRLNEHLLHTWDVEVALDPSAVVLNAELLVDNLDLIARYTAKPTGNTRMITVHTTDPPRSFTVSVATDAVTFTPSAGGGDADLSLPAEAFARLVYGRLDPEHTPPVDGDVAALDELRRVFPGP
jgi:uncharacterized protein (TIGR03083 family)